MGNCSCVFFGLGSAMMESLEASSSVLALKAGLTEKLLGGQKKLGPVMKCGAVFFLSWNHHEIMIYLLGVSPHPLNNTSEI